DADRQLVVILLAQQSTRDVGGGTAVNLNARVRRDGGERPVRDLDAAGRRNRTAGRAGCDARYRTCRRAQHRVGVHLEPRGQLEVFATQLVDVLPQLALPLGGIG